MIKNNILGHFEFIKTKIYLKRHEWRTIRSQRLARKDELLRKGITINEIRKDKIFKRLHKQQKNISKELKHLEKKINRFFN